jgi:ABC-type oligopeptide transport system substrate-binding subunit
VADQHRGRAVAVALGLALVLAGCTDHDAKRPAGAGASTTSAVAHPRGGTARVGVWQEPDVAAANLGGAAVRALVYPQLFRVQPDGSWVASLVEPGSERLAPDRRSASFRFRRGASWSDGTAITAGDLRRVPEPNVVAVDGPAPDGRITVRFSEPLPGWRRLWSVTSSVTPPRSGLWGGPFVVAEYTRGLEAVLRRNVRWYGGPRPLLDEVRLVLVPDPVTARQLLGRGELDVVMPPGATVRTDQLRALPDVSVETSAKTGWWVGLSANRGALNGEERRSLFRFVDRSAFVGTLLRGEATVLNGFAGSGDTTWRTLAPAGAKPPSVDLVGANEEPMATVLSRAMQRAGRAAGGDVALRAARVDQVDEWVATGMYEAAVVSYLDGPEVCWSCRWGSVDAVLAAAADSGDATAARRLERKLRDEALLLPLWRPTAVVAWRDGLHGVRVNGYAASAAWNADEWWRQ